MVRKESPVHVSTWARRTSVETATTIQRAHLTTHLETRLKARLLTGAIPIQTIIAPSKKLSILFRAVSRAYYGVKESQNALGFGEG